MTTDLQPTTMDLRSKIARAAQVYPVKAQTFLVVDAETFALGGTYLRDIQVVLDQLGAWMDPQIENAMDAKRSAEKARKGLVDDKDLLAKPLKAAKEEFGRKLDEYREAELQRAQEETARLQKILDDQAAERLLAEAVAVEQEALAAQTPEIREALLAELDTILEEPVEAPTALVPPPPKVAGFSRPETWEWETTDLTALLKALIEKKLDKVLTQELTVRIGEAILPPLNQRARALKSALVVPGGRAVSKKGTRMRA